jgi:serine/threonine protein kinase
MSAEIADRYELGERLGLGGMSTVHLAFDRRLERHVAVKLLAEHLAEDDQFISRFRREALSAARLVHPNIVQVYDFGLDEPTGRHFIVMEYIRGQSGAEILREQTRVAVDEALVLVEGACRGLEHAHRMGVIHRDVKPGNILRSEDGAVKLADFGIAKATLDQLSQITQVGSVLGTAAYLAPEQAAGQEAGPPADLYALGVVTYQLIAGRLPYDASSLTELALLQQREVPPRLDEVSPGVPPALALAVHRALALDPDHRYAGAEEMRAALRDGRRGIAPEGVEETLATQMLGSDDTAATRMAPASSARRLQPRAATRPAPVAYEDDYAEPVARREREPRRERRGRGRGRLALLWMLIAALVIAAVVIAAGSGNDERSVKLSPVDGSNTSEIVDQTRRLIDDNVR